MSGISDISAPAQEKAQLREIMKQRRKEIPSEERAKQSRAVTDMVLQTELYANARSILTYVSCGTELQTTELIRRALRDQKRVYAPVISGGSISFYEIEDMGQLRKNAMGISEPEPNPVKQFPYHLHLSLDKAEECVFFVPGLAFDRQLGRLGSGMGYYDRFLTLFRKKIVIGLAFQEQLVDQVPVTAADFPMDLVVTAGGAYY